MSTVNNLDKNIHCVPRNFTCNTISGKTMVRKGKAVLALKAIYLPEIIWLKNDTQSDWNLISL